MTKDNVKKWHAVYTKPRWEKKVFTRLEENGIVAYCPLNKIRKRWTDRYKIVNEPLFKSYVFVQVDDGEMQKVRTIPGVVNFVHWNNRPAVIKQEEIQTIKRFLNDYEYVMAEPLTLAVNQRVKIMSGVLMNEEGVVMRSHKNKVQVILNGLGYKLTVNLDKNEIHVI